MRGEAPNGAFAAGLRLSGAPGDGVSAESQGAVSSCGCAALLLAPVCWRGGERAAAGEDGVAPEDEERSPPPAAWSPRPPAWSPREDPCCPEDGPELPVEVEPIVVDEPA